MSFEVISEMEQKVRSFFEELNYNILEPEQIGIAVSGGADSIALLTCLCRIIADKSKIKVITINHNLRPKEETCGDADYVELYSTKLGVYCKRIDVPIGYINKIQKERMQGVEEAARYVRYSLFENFINEQHLKYLCLAHNQNDQVETVIMRFLSGASISSLSGIPKNRGKYIRPLYNISREEIETYLSLQRISFRTDKTNFDTAMYRNTVRNVIMPCLSNSVPGYTKAILSLAEKAREDNCFIEKMVDKALQEIEYSNRDNIIKVRASFFYQLDNAIKRRLLYKFIDEIKANSRVPYSCIDRIINANPNKKSWNEFFCGISVKLDNDMLLVSKIVKKATDECSFVIIREDGAYTVGDVTVHIVSKPGVKCFINKVNNVSSSICNLEYPFILRSVLSGDVLRCSTGENRSVSKIISDWHAGNKKNSLIIIQEIFSSSQKLKALLGLYAECPDWIVE